MANKYAFSDEQVVFYSEGKKEKIRCDSLKSNTDSTQSNVSSVLSKKPDAKQTEIAGEIYNWKN